MQSLVGKILSNRYRIDTFLGRGGMAEVYKVWDSRRMTFLAMKVLYEDLAIDHIFMRRFKREAQMLEKLQHPNIVRFYGLEQDGANAFMLLDYVEGKTLKRAIFDAGEPLPSKQLRFIMRSVCGALQFAHSEGLVHCDIKPANIMLHQNGTVLLADFGIARMTDAATATMVGAGTPAYMAPEQVRGEDPTPQTDIYALGIVLYEMLTGGERPFTGERAETTGSTSEKLRWEQMNMPPTNPRKWNPDLSPKLETVVLKCLKKNPKERYKTALDLFNALELATGTINADVEKTERPRPELDTVVEASFPPEPAPHQKPLTPPPLSALSSAQNTPTKNKWLWGTGVVLLILAIAVGSMIGGNSTTTPLPSKTITIVPSPISTSTPTLILTSTISSTTPENTSTPTITPTLGIGNTMISEKDGMVMLYIPEGKFSMGNSVEGYSYQCQDIYDSCVNELESLPMYSDSNRDDGDRIHNLCKSKYDICEKAYLSGEEPVHTVHIDEYWIDQTEITNAMFAKFLNAEGNQGENSENRVESEDTGVFIEKKDTVWQPMSGYANHPVGGVTWYGAQDYCEWAGRRLLTEAEWEKAARGGLNGKKYPWGDAAPTCTHDVENGAQYKDCHGETITIKSFFANGYGIYDMAGNVGEWVNDWYDKDYYGNSLPDNPLGSNTGENKVSRGISEPPNVFHRTRGLTNYSNPLFLYMRVTYRHSDSPHSSSPSVGFRCALSP